MAGPIHLNSRASPALNHVYRIFNTTTGEDLKYGISGIPLIGSKSLRAEVQITALGRGTHGYEIVAMARGRDNALWVERWLVTYERLRDPLSLPRNLRPKPWPNLP